MSFILDALRKSESERRQDEGPSLTRIPEALPRRGVPVWATATIAVLGVGLVALTGVWISTIPGSQDAARDTLQGSNGGADAASAVPAAPYAANAPDGVGTAAAPSATGAATRVEPLALPQARVARSAPATPSPDAAPTSSADTFGRGASPETSALAAAAGAVRTVAGDTSRSAPARPTGGASARSSLPQIDSRLSSYVTEAPALGLPELRLELLAFDDDPSLRFVFINGQKYAEGDTLSEGPRLIGINRRGAVLLANDRQLQLDQR